METEKLYDAAGDIESQKEWYKDGTLGIDNQYKNGKAISQKSWFENGVLGQESVYFLEGNHQGLPKKVIRYYNNTKIKKEWELLEESENIHITYNEYYPSGSIKDKFIFKKNTKFSIDDINTDNILSPNILFTISKEEYINLGDDQTNIGWSFGRKFEKIFSETYKSLDKGSYVYFENGQVFFETIEPCKNSLRQCSNYQDHFVNGILYNENKNIFGLYSSSDSFYEVNLFYYKYQGRWLPNTYCNCFSNFPINQATSLKVLQDYFASKCDDNNQKPQEEE
jgi:hypothetical protein